MEVKIGTYRLLVGRPEEKTLGRLGRRWQDNIKTSFQDVEWVGVD